MTKIKFLLTAFSFVLLTSFSIDNLPKVFSDLLERTKMTFDQPKGLSEIKPIENHQMNYEYALINKEKDFEVRYAIRPLDKMLDKYNEDKKKGTLGVAVHPNKLYSGAFEAVVLNISGGQFPDPTVFDSEAVKEEFNADWGATTFVELGKEFGQEYKYCVVVAIHKDDVGDAYCFYLFKTRENISSYMEELFHSLRFK